METRKSADKYDRASFSLTPKINKFGIKERFMSDHHFKILSISYSGFTGAQEI